MNPVTIGVRKQHYDWGSHTVRVLCLGGLNPGLRAVRGIDVDVVVSDLDDDAVLRGLDVDAGFDDVDVGTGAACVDEDKDLRYHCCPSIISRCQMILSAA